MEERRIIPPKRGVTDNAEFLDTPGDAAPIGSARNVRPTEGGTLRRRVGQRPGMVAAFPNVLPGQPQAMGQITKATGISGYSADSPLGLLVGGTRTITPYRMQAVVVDVDGSILLALNDTRATPAFSAPAAGPGGPGGFYACWNQDDPNIGYFGTLTKDTTHTTQNVWICGLNRFSVSGRAITHQAYVVDKQAPYTPPLGGAPTQGDTFPNQILQFGPYVFVASGIYIYTYRADDLTYIYRTTTRFAVEIQSIQCFAFQGRHWLLAAFGGSVAVSGPVVADTSPDPKEAFGEHFRAGVQLFEITYSNHNPFVHPPQSAPSTPAAQSVGSDPLVPRSMPQGTQNGDPWYESHRTYRLSEWMTSPVGRIPYDMAVSSQGMVYLAHANQGFGPSPLLNTEHRPNGPSNISATNEYACVSAHNLARAFDADAPATAWQTSPIFYINPSAAVRYGCGAGAGGWYNDVPNGSYRRTFSWGAGTYRCDIPPIVNGARDPANENYAPTAYAIALDEEADRVYVAGRRPATNSGRANVWCMRASDGTPIWEARLAGLIQQGCLAIDPTSGNLIVAGNRNAFWYANDAAIAPNGASAEVWELSASDGAVLSTFDMGDAVIGNGYIGTGYSGCGAYAVDVNANGQRLIALAPYRYDT